MALLGAIVATASIAAEPLATFECKEWVGLDWKPVLLHYQVKLPPARTRPGTVRLVDADGKEHPVQVSRAQKNGKAVVSFVAGLPKNGSFRYQLLAEKPTVAAVPCKAESGKEHLTLDNGIVALRLPAPGAHKLDPPLTFTNAPGPLQGIRLVDGRWVGGSHFFAEKPDEAPKVTGYECAVTEQGPLFVEARVRYRFDHGGYYQMTVRLITGDPAARVDEQYDMKRTGPQWNWRVMVSLGLGWKPDMVYGFSPSGALKEQDAGFVTRMKAAGLYPEASAHPSFGSRRIARAEPSAKLFDVAVRYLWHPAEHWFGLTDSAAISKPAAEQGTIPALAVVPIHAGNWRGASKEYDAMLFAHASGDVCLNWPLLAEPHPRTMLHSGEFDPDLPLTFCRRQWALFGGSLAEYQTLHAFRSYDGYVNLDDYKDWLLEWPENPKITYPRLIMSRSEIEKAAATVTDAAVADHLKHLLDPDAKTHGETYTNLLNHLHFYGPLAHVYFNLKLGDPAPPPGNVWITLYRQTQFSVGWAGSVDGFFGSPRITPEQRRTLRAHLAACAHLMAEPDFNPRGSMIHLGNPNMPNNRFYTLTLCAGLLPDHPLAKQWLEASRAQLRYRLAVNVAPTGVWSELITYHGAGVPFTTIAAAVLKANGLLDESTARLAVSPAKFPIHLLSPKDPRFGTRTIPAWGHEGNAFLSHFLLSAEMIAPLDPRQADALVWAWDQIGRPVVWDGGDHLYGRVAHNASRLASLTNGYLPEELKNSWLPGFGVTMRAHGGDPNETFFAYRQGYQVSHCDANQGDFVLFSKGAPLSTLALSGYAIHGGPFGDLYKQFGWHNRPRFSAQTSDGGWPGGGAISQVHAHHFSDSADYLRAMYDQAPQRWTRQVLFLKGRQADGPNYFVFRETFHSLDGDAGKLEPKWWYLRTGGDKSRVQAGTAGLSYSSPFGPKLNVHFLAPAAVQAESRDATTQEYIYFQGAYNWCKAGSPVVSTNPVTATVEETMTVTALGPVAPGEDMLVALYPQTPSEPPPQYESLGDGAAKITTSEATDYVFADRKPMKFAAGDVSFEGLAGAVRVYPDEVHLIISEGPGRVSYKGTTLHSAEPAVKIVPVAQLAKAQTFDVPAPKSQLKNALLPEGFRVEGNARCEVKLEPGRIVGRSEGGGGFLYAPVPPKLEALPVLWMDDQSYYPGIYGETLVIPLMPGKHSFEVRALEQPPIFRNWQAW